MNEQVTGISQVFKRLTSEMASTREVVDMMRAENVNLRRAMERLRAKSRTLHKQLEKYEEPKKSSNNSSAPPSKEPMKDEALRRINSLWRRSGPKPDRQPGHEGHSKGLVATPDVIEECGNDSCRERGRDLSDTEKELDYISQVVDLPMMAPTTTECRRYRKVCTCGCCNKGYTPRKRGNQVVFGRNTRTIVTYLSVVQCVPYERLASLMAGIFSIHMDQGTIRNIVREAIGKSKSTISLLEEMLKESVTVGFDESGCYNNKKLN